LERAYSNKRFLGVFEFALMRLGEIVGNVCELKSDPVAFGDRGGLFRISSPAGVSIEGTYREIVPNRKVVFTWGGVEGLKPGQSTVEFILEPDRKGTLIRLRHYGLPGPAVDSHRRGWVYSGFVKLKDVAEGRMPTCLCLSDLAEQRGAV